MNLSSNVLSLAEFADNAKMFSPLQAAELLLSEIKEGKVKPESLAIHILERNEDGSREHSSIIAGLNYPEHIALLSCALHNTIERWKK